MKVMVGGYVVRLAMFGNDEEVFLTITGAILTLLGLYKGAVLGSTGGHFGRH